MVHGERLLLVEDDAATREVLTLLLAGEGWAVDAVESGEAAMEALAAGLAPAVVLCDLQLPGICGEALLARVRQHLSEDAVVLAMTASVHGAAAAGYDSVAIKPFPPETIEAGWRLALRHRQPGQRERDALLHFGSGGIGGSVGSKLTLADLVQRERTGAADEAAVPGGDVGDGDDRDGRDRGGDVLDLDVMEQLRRSMGDGRMRDFYAFALADAGDRMDRMDAAMDGADGAAFVREAHALKGSYGMLGARAAWRLAADAEKEGLGTRSREKLLCMRTAMESVRLMLETLLPM